MHLTELNLELAFITYEYLAGVVDVEEAKPVTEYLSALGMLAKTDIHLRLEASAFNLFYNAFYLAIRKHEIIDSKTDIIETGYSQIEKMLDGREEFDNTILIKELQENKELSESITLRQVIAMKNYCEIYFLTIATRKLYKDNTLRLIPIVDGAL